MVINLRLPFKRLAEIWACFEPTMEQISYIDILVSSEVQVPQIEKTNFF